MITLPFHLSDALVHAFGWTLLHTLWQGAAIAGSLLLLLPRLHSARQRYRAAYAGLITMLAAALTTFALLYQPPVETPAGKVFTENDAVPGEVFTLNDTLAGAGSWSAFTHWLEARHPLIVMLWLLGFTFFLVRLLGSFFWVQQLRRRVVSVPDAAWTEKVGELARRLGQTRPVALLESGLVQAPMTVGWLKPLILFPIGLINQIAPAEVEAILAHELAHVARRDWLLNLIQAFVEALFYYHPAVWWLSGVVRAERENSCDDVAVSLTGNRLAYAKALVRVQEMARAQRNTPVLALGAAGTPSLLRRRPMLLERIQRILNQQHKKSQLMEKFIATSLLAALVALWGVRPQQAGQLTAALGEIASAPLAWFNESPDQEPALVPIAAMDTDSVPKGSKARNTQKIVQENDEGRVEMELQDGQITRLNINGQEVPPAEYERHQDLTDEMLREMTTAPTPPAPPMPTGVWVIPAMPPGTTMPPMPAMSPMSPMAPMAPMASMPAMGGNVSCITTQKDDQGNTVIRLMSNGQPTEITVKDNEVWIDGEKMEEGKPIPVPGGTPYYFWNGAEGQALTPGEGQIFAFQPAMAPEALAEMNAEQMKAFAEQREAQQKDMKRQEKEMKKLRKQMGKEQRQEMERVQQDMHRAEAQMRKQEIEMQRAHQEMARAQADMYRAQAEATRSGNFSAAIKDELQRDGLLPDPNHFSFSLNNKEMIVNGKKQPEPLRRKYLEIYRTKTGQDIGKDGNINIVENRD